VGVPKWERLSGSAEVGVHARLSEVGHFGRSSRGPVYCGTGHVEERAFRPGEGDEQRRAHHKFQPLRGGTRAYSHVSAWSVRGRRVGAGIRLLFCRWCVGRRAYDVKGLALAALRAPGATVPRGPRQSCQAHDERRDERPHRELNNEVNDSQPLHCARERARIGYSEYSRGVP
jgi:hypothetical protein